MRNLSIFVRLHLLALTVALAAGPSGAVNTARWMSDKASGLDKKQLNKIAIPAAHDAGTYAIKSGNPFGPDKNETVFFGIANELGIIAKWAKTQDRTISQMLDDGIRYLDLRVCINGSGEILTCHGLFGARLDEILDAVKQFTDNNPKEIVILGFTHFWDFGYLNDIGKEAGTKEGLRDANWTRLFELIKSKLAGKLISGEAYKPTSTFKEIWDGANASTSNQVIVEFDTNNGPKDPLIWKKVEANTWVEATDVAKYKTKTLSKLEQAKAGKYDSQFWGIRSSITPDNQMITRSFIPAAGSLFPSTNQELADMTNPVVLGWIKNEWSSYPINLIWSDFYNRTDLVALALWLNKIPGVIFKAPLGTKTNWYRWNCPDNFRDDGIYCAKPSSYGRGTGYPWKFGDKAFSLDGARSRCTKAHAQGCEKDGAIIYPKCSTGFHKIGCCICSPNCPSGMTDIGVSCKK